MPGLGDLAAADRVPRRVVVPVVRPPLSLCKPTGVTLGPESRVLVMCDRGGVGKALARRLEKLGCEVLLVEGAPPAETLVHRIEQWTAEKTIQGVYWLPALDVEEDLAVLTLEAWREALRVRVKLLYATMRALAPQVGASGTFLVSATRLGGQHGYDERGAVAPLGGAVTGSPEMVRQSLFILSALPYLLFAMASLMKYETTLAITMTMRMTKIQTSSWTWMTGFAIASTMKVISATPVTP